MKRAAMILILLFIGLCPATGFSYYIINLSNGSQIETGYYWENGDRITFYYRGGIVGIQKHLVQDIKTVESVTSALIPEPSQPTLPPQPPSPAADTVAAVQKPVERPDKDLEPFHEEFDQLNIQFEDVEHMSKEDLYQLARQMTGFRDKILHERLGREFSEELSEVYGMLDKIETLIEKSS